MSHDVSSWFIDQTKTIGAEPKRVFKIGTSDYSDRVSKWPVLKRTAQEIKAVNPRIPLANVDGALNHFFENSYLLPNTCTLQVGFEGVSSLGLGGHWKFDESSGTVASDETGTHDLTMYAIENTDWISGKAGNCIDLDGVAEYGGVNSIFISNQTELTISCWTFVHSLNEGVGLGTAQTPFVSDWNTQDIGAQKGFVLGVAHTGLGDLARFRFYINDGTDLGGLDADGVSEADWMSTYGGRWLHVAGVFKADEYVIIYVDGQVHQLTALSVPSQMTPENATETWFGRSGVPSGYLTGRLDEVRIFNRALSSTEIKHLYDYPSMSYGDELITVYTGYLKNVKYSKKECIALMKDRLWDFTQKKVGESDTPVEFTGDIPSDIAWTLCTCYGGLSTDSATNPDIDYTSFLEWSEILSRDNIICDAYYDGLKISEALSNLAKMTDSAIWVEGDGKINFKRFTNASSLDMVLTIDNEILDLTIDVETQRLINKQGVAFNFAPESDYFQSTLYYQDSTSVNTYGLNEELIEDETIWFTNSVHAINLAQRRVAHYKDPPKLFNIKTPLVGIHRQLGETIRVVDSFYAQTSADAWTIKEYNYHMNNDQVDYMVDGAATLTPFILDVSTLDQAIEVLI